MSSHPARRRPAPALAGLALVVALLAGCGTGQGSAENYGQLEDNFLDGCEAVVAEDAEASEVELPADFCQCAFDALSDEDDGVPFDELMEINDDFREDPARLPESVTSAFADCASDTPA